jgi:hypothetical protein
MAWPWSERDVLGDGVGVMEAALVAAMDAAADRGESREAGGRRFASYLRAIAKSGPQAAIALTASGVRVAYGDIPPEMRWYWGIDPVCGRCLILLNWAWCLPDAKTDNAVHQSKLREAEMRLEGASVH